MLVGCPWRRLLPIVIRGEVMREKEINQLVGESTEKRGGGELVPQGLMLIIVLAEKETHEQKRNAKEGRIIRGSAN